MMTGDREAQETVEAEVGDRRGLVEHRPRLPGCPPPSHTLPASPSLRLLFSSPADALDLETGGRAAEDGEGKMRLEIGECVGVPRPVPVLPFNTHSRHACPEEEQSERNQSKEDTSWNKTKRRTVTRAPLSAAKTEVLQTVPFI